MYHLLIQAGPLGYARIDIIDKSLTLGDGGARQDKFPYMTLVSNCNSVQSLHIVLYTYVEHIYVEHKARQYDHFLALKPMTLAIRFATCNIF